MKPRHCRFCKRPLGLYDGDGKGEQHCDSPSCHWCTACEQKKRAAAK